MVAINTYRNEYWEDPRSAFYLPINMKAVRLLGNVGVCVLPQ